MLQIIFRNYRNFKLNNFYSGNDEHFNKSIVFKMADLKL